MRIEHVGLAVPDPAASAGWYVEHLGCELVRASDQEPYAHFVRAPGGAMMVEFFRSPHAPVPDWWSIDALQGHLSFYEPDIETACARLHLAGATGDERSTAQPDGDRYAMLRDPWGLPLQLVLRAAPML